MKKLDKIILALFSTIMFLASILVIALVVGWIKLSTINTIEMLKIKEATFLQIFKKHLHLLLWHYFYQHSAGI